MTDKLSILIIYLTMNKKRGIIKTRILTKHWLQYIHVFNYYCKLIFANDVYMTIVTVTQFAGRHHHCEWFSLHVHPIIANHGFESASFLSNWVMKERIDENHLWVTDDDYIPVFHTFCLFNSNVKMFHSRNSVVVKMK